MQSWESGDRTSEKVGVVDRNMDIPSLKAAYAAGASAADVVRDSYRRIAAVDDAGIFISLVPEAAAR